MKKIIYLFALTTFLFGCGESRPDGSEIQSFLEHLNKVSRPGIKGNQNEYYTLLSKDFIASFESEIEKAKKLDSAEVRQLPAMEMLRILSLKNSLSEVVKTSDSKTILQTWLSAAGKGFPLQNADRFYYTPKQPIESKMLKDGMIVPQVLIYEEAGTLKVNPIHSPEFQRKRLENILQKREMEDLIKDAAWLHFQTDRRISWDRLD